MRSSVPASRDVAVTLGLAANGLLAVLFFAAVAIIVYDVLVG
jgi:hypothetical protein